MFCDVTLVFVDDKCSVSRYISGVNQVQEEVAMTRPVVDMHKVGKPLYQARESSLVPLCPHQVQFRHKT